MKHKLILIITFLICSTISFGQEYKVTYQFDVSELQKKIKENLPPEERSGNIILRAVPHLKNFEPILWINNQEALFETKIRMDRDSENGLPLKIAKIISYEKNGSIYQDLKSEFSLRPVEKMGTNFIVIYPFDEFNWQISKEKQTIHGIEAQKATTVINQNKKDMQVEAWFASSIPISSGPLEYGGLPGLIIKLTIDSNYIVILKDIQDTPKEEKIIEKPKGTPISHQEYLKQVTELKNKSPYAEYLKN